MSRPGGNNGAPYPRAPTSEEAKERAAEAWYPYRERVLRKFGLWGKWNAVPKPENRDDPLESYLPGGDNYDPPED